MLRTLPTLSWLTRLKSAFELKRHARRIETLRERGMHIGRDVNFPESLYVDERYCALISIGDSTSFGPECMILAHDPSLYTSRGKEVVGPVSLHESSHIGARTVILPSVEIGPRTIVAAGSVVARSLPADTVCAGRPARPFSTLEQYLDTHARRIRAAKRFEYGAYSIQYLDRERRLELVRAAVEGDAYITGGRKAELLRVGGSLRTPLEGYSPPPPRDWSHATPRGEGG